MCPSRQDDLTDSVDQKWENKLLETKAADFRQAGTGKKDSPEDESDNRSRQTLPSIQPLLSGPAFYPSSSNGNQYYSPSQYSSNGQYAGGLALPAMGHEDVRVKAEPDEPIRPRGGAVSMS